MNLNDLQALGQLVESMNQVFWICTPDMSKYSYVSPGYEKIWGRSCAELLENPSSFIESIHPDDRKRITKIATGVGAHNIDEEYRIIRPDSSVRWIRDRTFTINDSNEKVSWVVGIAEDISARKISELEQNQSLKQFCQFAENVDIVFWVCDVEVTQFLYISPTYEKIWGRSCASLYERPLSFVDSIHPEDLPSKMAAIQRNPTSMNELYRIIQPDGTIRWIHDRTFPVLDENGKVYRMVGIAEDITKRKVAETSLRESEEKFQQFANNADIVFWVCEPDASKFYYISPAYEKIWGKSCASIYDNPQSFLESVHPDDYNRVITATEGENACNMNEDYRIIRPDGSIRWVNERTFPVYDNQGKVFRMTGIAEDITVRKNAEAEALKALQRERELSDIKSQFVTATSHEVRTPLAVIQSSIDILQHYTDSLSEDKKQRHFKKIESAISKIQNLVQNVLSLSESEADSLQFQPHNIDVESLCQEIITNITENSNNHNRIQFNFIDGTYRMFSLDPRLVGHILNNLLDNALKYSNQNSIINFDVNCEQQSITFCIEDKGIGIHEEDLPYIFDSFYRAKNVGTASGMGLGLFITKECVNLHKGEITVNSTVGEGTRFVITLPSV